MSQPYIYLGYYHGHSIAVSDEAYEQIKALIETGKICKECSSHYSESNPETARNVCLNCFLGDENRKPLKYIGPYAYDTEYAGITSHYRYEMLMDTRGHIYTISPEMSQTEAREDEALTMKHWGFQVPEQVVRDGEVIVLHRSEWSIRGDVHNPVIVGINNQSHYHGNKTFAFLLYKDKEALELNKRKSDIRDLFREAKRRIEATKDENGYYHTWEDYTFSYDIEDHNCYAWIAQIEMEREEARKMQAVLPARPIHLKQDASKEQDRPSFGNPEWIQIAKGKMYPWERAIWKDVLGDV